MLYRPFLIGWTVFLSELNIKKRMFSNPPVQRIQMLLFPAHLFDGFALSFMIYLKSLYEVCQIPFLFSSFYGKIKV